MKVKGEELETMLAVFKYTVNYLYTKDVVDLYYKVLKATEKYREKKEEKINERILKIAKELDNEKAQRCYNEKAWNLSNEFELPKSDNLKNP